MMRWWLHVLLSLLQIRLLRTGLDWQGHGHRLSLAVMVPQNAKIEMHRGSNSRQSGRGMVNNIGRPAAHRVRTVLGVCR